MPSSHRSSLNAEQAKPLNPMVLLPLVSLYGKRAVFVMPRTGVADRLQQVYNANCHLIFSHLHKKVLYYLPMCRSTKCVALIDTHVMIRLEIAEKNIPVMNHSFN